MPCGRWMSAFQTGWINMIAMRLRSPSSVPRRLHRLPSAGRIHNLPMFFDCARVQQTGPLKICLYSSWVYHDFVHVLYRGKGYYHQPNKRQDKYPDQKFNKCIVLFLLDWHKFNPMCLNCVKTGDKYSSACDDNQWWRNNSK